MVESCFNDTYVYIFSYLDDGLSDPRSRSVTGATLPHVRTVSNVVHAAAGRQRRSQTLTLQAFQMGQFLDHDIIATPVQSGNYSS